MVEAITEARKHFGTQLENTTYLLSLQIAIESHIAKALDASQVVQRTLDLLVESLAKAKEGNTTATCDVTCFAAGRFEKWCILFPPTLFFLSR